MHSIVTKNIFEQRATSSAFIITANDDIEAEKIAALEEKARNIAKKCGITFVGLLRVTWKTKTHTVFEIMFELTRMRDMESYDIMKRCLSKWAQRFFYGSKDVYWLLTIADVLFNEDEMLHMWNEDEISKLAKYGLNYPKFGRT